MPAVLLPDEQDFLKGLGELVRKARIVAGMRQKDLSGKTGLSLGTIRRMESGKGGSVALSAWVSVFGALGIFSSFREAVSSINPDPFKETQGRIRVRK